MKKGDILLICAVLILAATGLIFMNLGGKKSGGTLTVTVRGEIYETYDLEIIVEVYAVDVVACHYVVDNLAYVFAVFGSPGVEI